MIMPPDPWSRRSVGVHTKPYTVQRNVNYQYKVLINKFVLLNEPKYNFKNSVPMSKQNKFTSNC